MVSTDFTRLKDFLMTFWTLPKVYLESTKGQVGQVFFFISAPGRSPSGSIKKFQAVHLCLFRIDENFDPHENWYQKKFENREGCYVHK